VGGQTAAVLYSVIGTCKHLLIDQFAFFRDAVPGLFALFALGEEPTAEQLKALENKISQSGLPA